MNDLHNIITISSIRLHGNFGLQLFIFQEITVNVRANVTRQIHLQVQTGTLSGISSFTRKEQHLIRVATALQSSRDHLDG